MLAMRFDRGQANPTVCISFGTRELPHSTETAVNGTIHARSNTVALGGVAITGVGVGVGVAPVAANIAQYQFPIPTALAFQGVPANAVPAIAANTTVDLFGIQQRVLTAV